MKDKILAVVILILILVSVTINALVLNNKIDDILAKVKDISIAENSTKTVAESIYADFMQDQKYISLTVSHDDMTQIEEDFTELIAYLDIGDTDGAKIAKSRLINSLEHLRRLSDFNIDSII